MLGVNERVIKILLFNIYLCYFSYFKKNSGGYSLFIFCGIVYMFIAVIITVVCAIIFSLVSGVHVVAKVLLLCCPIISFMLIFGVILIVRVFKNCSCNVGKKYILNFDSHQTSILFQNSKNMSCMVDVRYIGKKFLTFKSLKKFAFLSNYSELCENFNVIVNFNNDVLVDVSNYTKDDQNVFTNKTIFNNNDYSRYILQYCDASSLKNLSNTNKCLNCVINKNVCYRDIINNYVRGKNLSYFNDNLSFDSLFSYNKNNSKYIIHYNFHKFIHEHFIKYSKNVLYSKDRKLFLSKIKNNGKDEEKQLSEFKFKYDFYSANNYKRFFNKHFSLLKHCVSENQVYIVNRDEIIIFTKNKFISKYIGPFECLKKFDLDSYMFNKIIVASSTHRGLVCC